MPSQYGSLNWEGIDEEEWPVSSKGHIAVLWIFQPFWRFVGNRGHVISRGWGELQTLPQ